MADTKISALSAVTVPTGADELVVIQASTSKKMTLAQMKTFLAPTIPTLRATTAEFTGTGVPTATLPTGHALNDILILAIQSSNDSAVTPPAGYARIGPQNGIGSPAAAGSTKMSLFWKRDNGSEAAPTIPDTGDHTYGFMTAIIGCPTTGDPFHFLGNTFKQATTTAFVGPTGQTTVDNCLILIFASHGVDNAAGQAGAATNADLASITEVFDDGTTDGTGGGITLISGTKIAAGPIGATTWTWANTSVDVSTMIAMLPADTTEVASSPRPTEVQMYLGSIADLDDTWTKPTGAAKVFVQLCDGGGAGSGGNIATTAAGGGGGGGGGYDEAEFRPVDLTATVTLHAGRGGAVGTALNQAGAVGTVSEFEKGGRGPLTSAYRITQLAATAAGVALGGAGGSGSGGGATARAVGARIALHDATAGVAFGTTGGRGGGPGGTAPIGGSPAHWGGGGGESGGDTDAATTSALNGFSLRGGGGGSSGRTNTNISGSGAGGGAPGVISAQGAVGSDSTHIPYGGSGGVGGGSSVVTGGSGGFPGGGGGGGAGVAGGFGGRGGHGCIVVTTHF